MLKNIFLFGFVFLMCNSLMGQSTSDESQETSTDLSSVENALRYKQSLTAPELDYNLEPISEGHFKLIFINRPSEYVRIKIYDIIGNLVLAEDKKYALKNEIEYNFNELNNKIYVVKVESGDDNLTKKVNF